MNKKVIIYLMLIIIGISIACVGFAQATTKVTGEFANTIINAPLKHTVVNGFKSSIFLYINNIYVSTLLISLGIIGIIAEMFIPGFGAFGAVGILSFILFFGGKMAGGYTQGGMLILFILGIILLGIEVVIPGFGISGITGIICIALSILLSSSDLLVGSISFFAALVISITVLRMIFKYIPRNEFLSKIILKNEQRKNKGYTSTRNDKKNLIGQEGEALTLLRPAGMISIEKERIDVISNGEYIEKGAKVKIIAVEGNKVVVQKLDN